MACRDGNAPDYKPITSLKPGSACRLSSTLALRQMR